METPENAAVRPAAASESPPDDSLPVVAPDTSKAARLRAAADTLTKDIGAKMNPSCGEQRPTRRRAEMAEHMRSEGRRLQEAQRALRSLAQANEAGRCPALLAKVRSVADIKRVLFYASMDERRKLGLAVDADLQRARAWIAANSEAEDPAEAVKRNIKAMEMALIGRKIPGYFLTPPDLAALVIREAEIEPGMDVLEPSAGKGSLAEPAVAAGGKVTCYEINRDLLEILKAKGLSAIERDFLRVIKPWSDEDKWSRVVLNPPFEALADADHIQHAYQFLKPGGRMVAIMSPSAWHRKDKTAAAFREWICSLDDWLCYKLPDGSFNHSDNSTGVSTRLLIINKPAAAEIDTSADA